MIKKIAGRQREVMYRSPNFSPELINLPSQFFCDIFGVLLVILLALVFTFCFYSFCVFVFKLFFCHLFCVHALLLLFFLCFVFCLFAFALCFCHFLCSCIIHSAMQWVLMISPRVNVWVTIIISRYRNSDNNNLNI